MSRATKSGPLAGVRVLEITKVWAGPHAGKLLAYLGAEVIKVESYGSLDPTRRYGVKDPNKSPGFQAINIDKCSVQLDTKTDEGSNLLKALVARSDVVLDNLRPGAMDRSGLGYEALRAIKPDIIAVGMSMHGREGPLSYQTGYAPCFAALGGVSNLVGYEGGPPQLLNVRYADSTYGIAAAFATVVALFHHRRTGEGQFVDVSAVESVAAVVGDSFMSYGLEGRIPTRDGNRHSEMAPHGCYPCRDEDWLSLAIATEQEWSTLCQAMGRPELRLDPRFCDLTQRQQHVAELDAIVGSWTAHHEARELGASLQARGVAAVKSLNTIDIVSEAHLWDRGFFRLMTDQHGNSTPVMGPPWRMSLTPTGLTQPAPSLGEHNDYVLGEILGLSAEQRQRLVADKVVY